MSNQTLSRIGWALSAIFALFMIGASAAPKLLQMPMVTDIMTTLGWPTAPTLLIGLLELGLTLLFLFPPTATLSAILMTGLYGGAIVTNLRADQPLVSHTLFGIYLGILMWVALWLRDPALRTVFPLRRND